MTTLDELTGSLIRSQAILSIVQEAIDEGENTLEAVARKASRFGESFGDLASDEYAAALEMLAPSKSLENVRPPHANGTAPAAEATPQPEMTRDEAVAHLKTLNDTLHAARQERMKCEADVRAARAAMSAAIAQWHGVGGGYTRDMLVKAELRAFQQHKQDVKDGKVNPRTQPGIANSVIDRSAAYSGHRGADANDFARRQMQNGGYRRGSFPASARGRRIAVPSER